MPASGRFWFLIVLAAVDMLMVNAGYVLAFYLRFGGDLPQDNLSAYFSTWPWLSLTALALMYFYRLYGPYRWRWTEVFAGLICVVFFQAVVGMSLSFLFRGFAFPRSVFVLAPFIQLVLLSLWRRAAWHWERMLLHEKKVLVVGQPADARDLAGKLEQYTGGVYKVSGLVVGRNGGSLACGSGAAGEQAAVPGDGGGKPGGGEEGPHESWPVLGDISCFCECLDSTRPDEVFVSGSLSQEDKAEVLYACVARDTAAFLVPDFYEILITQARLDQVDDVPVFAVGRLNIPRESMIFKRVLDILLSLAGLAVALPVLLPAAVLIKIDSPGPVIYRQKRLTDGGQVFYLYKLRTMVDGAEAGTGPVLAAENDPRVTRVGRVLRALRIDEIPQLINVLRGDMSLVGPRPERPFFVNQLMRDVPEYVYRMKVKSGLTGLAQVAGKYSTSPENKLKYDLLYTKSYSPARDIAILFQTIKVLLIKDRAS
ncbi:MAG: sugar transferase [Peptococcaceae bacterium]|nr:sugar transferase [Peptococcaceae bacterium]